MKKFMKKKILLDIDEVFCFSGYLELVNEFLNTNYKIDDFDDYYIDEVAIPEDKKEEFYKFASTKDQYANPVILPGAIDAISILSKYYDIYPCSDCRNPFDLKNSGRIFASKFDLLFKTFEQDIIPAKNYIFTGTKNLFQADIQVDDLVSNLDSNIPIKILFPSYHNKQILEDELVKKGIIRAGFDWKTGWLETEKILMEIIKNMENKTDLKK